MTKYSQGKDYYHDDVDAMEVEEKDTEEAEVDEEAPSCSSEDDDGDDRPALPVDAAAAGDGDVASAGDLESTSVEIVPLSAEQSNTVHQVQATIASLEATIETLRGIGQVRAVQCIEAELKKERRRERQLVTQSPAVADAFARLRRAEKESVDMQKRLAQQQQERKRAAAEADADSDAAKEEFKRVKKT